MPEEILHEVEGALDERAHGRLGFFHCLERRFLRTFGESIDRAALGAVCQSIFRPGAAFRAGVAGVAMDLLLLSVQQPGGLLDVGNVRHRDDHGMHPMPSKSAAMCAFSPKNHCWPFLVWCISGSRCLFSILVEDGAAMSVASTCVPARSSSRTTRTSKKRAGIKSAFT